MTTKSDETQTETRFEGLRLDRSRLLGAHWVGLPSTGETPEMERDNADLGAVKVGKNATLGAVKVGKGPTLTAVKVGKGGGN